MATAAAAFCESRQFRRCFLLSEIFLPTNRGNASRKPAKINSALDELRAALRRAQRAKRRAVDNEDYRRAKSARQAEEQLSLVLRQVRAADRAKRAAIVADDYDRAQAAADEAAALLENARAHIDASLFRDAEIETPPVSGASERMQQAFSTRKKKSPAYFRAIRDQHKPPARSFRAQRRQAAFFVAFSTADCASTRPRQSSQPRCHRHDRAIQSRRRRRATCRQRRQAARERIRRRRRALRPTHPLARRTRPRPPPLVRHRRGAQIVAPPRRGILQVTMRRFARLQHATRSKAVARAQRPRAMKASIRQRRRQKSCRQNRQPQASRSTTTTKNQTRPL